MATLLLSAAGTAFGGSLGGSIAGLATGAIGKAAGATLGSAIDQRLLGVGSEPVETGRVERFRMMGGSEGAPLPRAFGRIRVAGQVIWSSRFLEDVDSTRVGGKGAGGAAAQEVREYSYSISLAIALCEGEVARVGRVWADGQQISLAGITWRLHKGDEDQLPDPLIAAIEGAENALAYRGTAYVVLENLALAAFGNRIPQFNFEVFRPAQASTSAGSPRLDVRAVALVPGTGEYALATEPVSFSHGKGRTVVANVNNDRGRPDFVVSIDQMQAELPKVKAASLVVSWFGDDLRCDRCAIQPAVEQTRSDGRQMPWRVAGADRSGAKVVSRLDGRPLFGGTPSDASVVQAIRHLGANGCSVMFYPFILMDVPVGNDLEDPWTGEVGQPPVPWRGRITLSEAPGRPGSPDKTPASAEEVERFFGNAGVADFRIENGGVVYAGPQEWSYRRFILHYAHLCAAAGGVEAFCIGSEMRSLTQIRDGRDSYPAVRALCALAEDVRKVLGPDVKIGYAADWSEYFGHHPADGSGDLLFHLDPLWSHGDVDFIGIDNYMPLSDWRDESDHLDASAGSIYDLSYLTGNVAGGEGFDWYYEDAEGRAAQRRLSIKDGAYGEDWVFRYKDIRSWWDRPHVNRIGGVKADLPTSWRPRSKPIRFTELGCPAVDKGTNQPNVFYDPKSSESFFPYFSNGGRDEFIQQRYLQATYQFWGEAENNPVSDVYGGAMLDLDHAYVWAWDARPWPDFPDRLETWADGSNYDRGHWINTRLALPALSEIVEEVCERSGVDEADVGGLAGCVTGYAINAVETARQSLQPLMLAFGFDSFSRGERLAFVSRAGVVAAAIDPDALAVDGDEPVLKLSRGSDSDSPGRVALGFIRAENDYQPGVAEVTSPEVAEPDVSQSALPIVFSDGEATQVAQRWLTENRTARTTVEFGLPPSMLSLTAGDLVRLSVAKHSELFRVDRVEDMGRRAIRAVRVEPGIYRAQSVPTSRARPSSLIQPTEVYAEFLDLPLLTGNELPHAPFIGVTKTPWAGAVAVYSSAEDYGYRLVKNVLRPAIMGETLEPLPAGSPGVWMRNPLRVRLASGALRAADAPSVLNGQNVAALRFGGMGDWEVIQFETAELVGPNEYIMGGLLRGQAGTDGVMPPVLPAGADFVLLDGAVSQIALPSADRGLPRHYRVGPAVRAYDDASYAHFVAAFSGVGLRPYGPVHLAATRSPEGEMEVTWIRRSRIDGDSWEGADVPLGEERELYHVVVRRGDLVLAERYPETSRVVLSAADLGGPEGEVVVEIAQVSARFGAGPASRMILNL